MTYVIKGMRWVAWAAAPSTLHAYGEWPWISSPGYTVSTAQNGQEAWNLLRLNDYDLLISDVDMPQMNGIELITRVRANPRLGRIPAIILSYKDREEDRRRGLDAGADFYLTKGSFDNGSFLQAVVDLVGEAAPATGEQA